MRRLFFFNLLLFGLISSTYVYGQSNVATVSINNLSITQEPPIEDGERLSEWMLKERRIQNGASQNYSSTAPYYLGTSWLTSKEITDQEIEKQSLINVFEKIHFPENNVAAQKIKTAFAKMINSMQITGRVPLPNTNVRYLEASPKLNPVLESTDRVVVPATPTTITVIRSNGSLCNIRYRPNVETRHYIQGCRLRNQTNERDADWAWLVEPDGTIHKVSVASWNSAKQDLPAPGSWIWAPPRWSIWTTKSGDQFSEVFANMLAVQGPSGLPNSLDNSTSVRGSLPSENLKDLYSISRDLPISANIWGETGLMQTPSARTAPAGTGAITLGWFNPYANVNLFFAPVDAVEFIMRYTNMNNVVYTASGGSQTNKDKSTGLKVRLIKENYFLPEVAVGARDMLGTGLFSGEYFVASKRHKDFDFSLGMGWGQLGTP